MAPGKGPGGRCASAVLAGRGRKRGEPAADRRGRHRRRRHGTAPYPAPRGGIPDDRVPRGPARVEPVPYRRLAAGLGQRGTALEPPRELRHLGVCAIPKTPASWSGELVEDRVAVP